MTTPDPRVLRLLQEARQQLESERLRRSEAIAIVGMGCRFPGGAESPETFWQLLTQGVDATGEVPADRWDAAALYDPDRSAAGKCYVKRGGFLARIDEFDPEFFGISSREARSMDPQQRLLLEVTWEALEDAGIVPGSLAGSSTGVWVGLSLDDYARRSTPSGRLDQIDAYTALGNSRSVAAGRIAYVLGVHGPALQLDTACSSSLVALHLACQSLRAGECTLALLGGVSLMSSPEASVALCRLQALSADGRCRTFDASADGYGRAEGCGLLVLKTISAARAAGDRVYAVIRGSAVNHDGRSNGLAAPNGLAQEAVIRAALSNSGIEPHAVGYVEAHGTGTALGDPIEVLALNRVYGSGRSKETPLYLGSVKTNLGHLEAASGMAALIKTALCVWHEQLVPHLHCSDPNPRIPWLDLPVRISHEASEFRAGVAAVHSFGISGTNAHVLLAPAPIAGSSPALGARSDEPIFLSGRTEHSLRASAARLREHLGSHPDSTVLDLAFSLATTRTALPERAAFPVSTRDDLLAALDTIARGEKPPWAAFGRADTARGKLAWLFPGSGSPRAGIGQALSEQWPAFRAALDEACAAFDRHLELPLQNVVFAAPGTPLAKRLEQPRFAAAAWFAMGWALAALWRSWGMEPDYLAGHAIGELCAACFADVFTLDDAARLVSAQASTAPDETVRVANSIAYRMPSIPIVSASSGHLAREEITTAEFWIRNLAQTVPFADGVRGLRAEGVGTVLELGFSASLLPLVSSELAPRSVIALASGRTGVAEVRGLLDAQCGWFACGGPLDFRALFPTGARRIQLPTYPFERERYWLESPELASAASAERQSRARAASKSRRFAREFARRSAAEQRAWVTQTVREEIARVRSLGNAAAVPLDAALQDLGFDSLLTLELNEALLRRTGLKLPAAHIYDRPSARVIAQLLIEQARGASEPTSRARPSAPHVRELESHFERDAELDPALRPTLGPLAATQPASLLLTGGTGFLGAYLLHDLLRGTRAQVSCLVRAADVLEGTRRLAANLSQYGLWDDAFLGRLSVLPGDLRAPRLGLDQATFDRLAENLDAIYSNGAVTGFVASYRELESSHVNATNEIVRLAASGRSKAIHHVSSSVVFDAAAYRRKTITESTDPVEHCGIYLGYSQAKWVTESLIRAAGARGFPVTIHRPGFIAGSSRDGTLNSGDFLARMFKAIIEMGALPGDLEIELDFSPVDYVSRSVVYLSLQPTLHGRAFHLQHPNGISFQTLGEILRSLGHPVRLLGYWDWVAELETLPAGPLAPLLPFLTRRWGSDQLTYMELWQRSQRPKLTCDATLEALRPSAIECPALDRNLIERYLQHL